MKETIVEQINLMMDEFTEDNADWYPAYKVSFREANFVYVSEPSSNSSGYESFEIRFTGMGWGCEVDEDGGMDADLEDATVTQLSAEEAQEAWQELVIEYVFDSLESEEYSEEYLKYQTTLSFHEVVMGCNSHQVMELMNY